MKKIIVNLCMVMLMVTVHLSTALAQQDIKGSKDHPLITRMPDFNISEYKEGEFDTYKFIGADRKPLPVEGHKYYIAYKLTPGLPEPGELKIRRNVQDALKKIGGKVLFDDNFNRVSTILVEKDNRETWVEVRTFNNLYRLSIVEKEKMKQDLVANADAMGNDINNTGHVSVYGIYFDSGKSEIKPESDAALEQISSLLKSNEALKLYVVGHTDNVGTIDSNMKLSKDRADAVVASLTTKYGVSAARLKAYGVASLTPVASNDSEEGKAKNRRVELVKQ